MKKSIISREINPSENFVKDALTEFIRESAQKMLKAAIEAEMTEFIDTHQSIGTDGKKQVVRNGYLPARKVQTGAGPIEVEIPRVRRRSKEPLVFTSSLVPKYMRRSVTVNVLLPLLYLKGISTKDFSQCFEPILGESPKNLSPNVISRLKNEWGKEFDLWGKRDLSLKKYVYFWADGIYLQARMEGKIKNEVQRPIG